MAFLCGYGGRGGNSHNCHATQLAVVMAASLFGVLLGGLSAGRHAIVHKLPTDLRLLNMGSTHTSDGLFHVARR